MTSPLLAVTSRSPSRLVAVAFAAAPRGRVIAALIPASTGSWRSAYGLVAALIFRTRAGTRRATERRCFSERGWPVGAAAPWLTRFGD